MKFLLQFCCMNLIAATRAEGGLVFYIIEEVIELDELNEGNISAAAGKSDILWMSELGCATLGQKLSSATHVRVSYLFNNIQKMFLQ